MNRPFLRWAGGKRWFIRNYSHLLPTNYEVYHEPFFGSGAVFFYLKPERAIISDINTNLMDTYLAVQKNFKRVEMYLQEYQISHSKEFYYKVRKTLPRGLYQRAALFIYLNRTSWNGLYRVNKKGEFNVPIGTRSSIDRGEEFSKINELLAGVVVEHFCFTEAFKNISAGDFVFVDPPYTVKHDINGFLKYNENLFSWDDQIVLSEMVCKLGEKGAKILVLNANHKTIIELYSNYGEIHLLSRNSMLSGNSAYRGTTQEIAVKIGY